MGKLLLWVVIILAVLIVIRVVAARNRARQDVPPPVSPTSSQTKTQAESMVRCAHCGIHLPRSEATLLNGKTWCGSEHAKLGER